jgi:hypothetical protein
LVFVKLRGGNFCPSLAVDGHPVSVFANGVNGDVCKKYNYEQWSWNMELLHLQSGGMCTSLKRERW